MRKSSAHSDPQAAAETLEHMLRRGGFDACHLADALGLPSGLRLQAAVLETLALADGRIAAVVRIVAFHDTAFSAGLPEVLHAAGRDAQQALEEGLGAWVRGALPVLEDAVRGQVRHSALLAINSPPQGAEPVAAYQAILGPILYVDGQAERYGEDEESCPACMTTRMQDLLRERLSGDGVMGLALVAGRDAQGRLIADCRINGEHFADGAERLLAYARSWAGSGLDIRSQYVIIRPPPAGGANGPQG
jgi:hypothetical protein